MYAEFEADLIRAREGMAVAKAKGRLRWNSPNSPKHRKRTWSPFIELGRAPGRDFFEVANRLGFAARGGPRPGRQSRSIAAGSYSGGIASLHFPECHPIIGSSGTFREKRENAAPPDLAPSLAHQPSRTCSLTTSALVLRRQKRKALR